MAHANLLCVYDDMYFNLFLKHAKMPHAQRLVITFENCINFIL